MTTVIRTRIPLEPLKMSQQSTGRRKSKRLAVVYDEEDGDFVFKRASKRTKTTADSKQVSQVPQTEPIVTTTRTTRERPEEVTSTTKKKRSKRESVATSDSNVDTIAVPKRRRSARLSSEKPSKDEDPVPVSGHDATEIDAVELVGGTNADESHKSFFESSKQGTMIVLPFSDTPVINRNKELRKKGNGSRRSSLAMRGRRASSLIESGHSALPHREVETHDFYKHIEAEGLTEPRRMKQLLTWVGERALGEKPSHGKDSGAELAARVIKEQLLKDFGNKSEFSDWFSREDTGPPTKIITKPNPSNIQTEQRIAASEARIKLLKQERDQWKAFSKSAPALPPIIPTEAPSITPSQIDASLLDPEQAAILSLVTTQSADSLRANAQQRLQALHSSLEFKVDQFADGVHKVEQYQATVSRVADRILSLCARKLEERDAKEKESVGTKDVPIQEVLRSLSRILPDESNR